MQSNSEHPIFSPLSKNSRNTVYKLRFANVRTKAWFTKNTVCATPIYVIVSPTSQQDMIPSKKLVHVIGFVVICTPWASRCSVPRSVFCCLDVIVALQKRCTCKHYLKRFAIAVAFFSRRSEFALRTIFSTEGSFGLASFLWVPAIAGDKFCVHAPTRVTPRL